MNLEIIFFLMPVHSVKCSKKMELEEYELMKYSSMSLNHVEIEYSQNICKQRKSLHLSFYLFSILVSY